jgi:hypothetical protein
MKMSLRLMTCGPSQMDCLSEKKFSNTHILVPQVLQELQLAVGTLGQDRCAERLHDLLDSNGLVCELILGRTGDSLDARLLAAVISAHQTRPNAP